MAISRIELHYFGNKLQVTIKLKWHFENDKKTNQRRVFLSQLGYLNTIGKMFFFIPQYGFTSSAPHWKQYKSTEILNACE